MIWIIGCIIGVAVILFFAYSLCVVASRADAHLVEQAKASQARPVQARPAQPKPPPTSNIG